MKHIIGVTAFIAAITLALWAWLGAGFEGIFPLRASEEAAYVDRLFGMHLYVIAFLFALIMGFIIYSIVMFRSKPGDDGDGQYFHGHTTLEIVWTVIPLGVVLYFSALGAQYLAAITSPEANELVVEVTGSQWNWRFDYPEYGIASNTLYLPVDRQTRLDLTSIDVIHDFWVPEFRVKQDAVPGMVIPLRITPTEIGEYTMRCAELCGRDHSYMVADVLVMEQDGFAQWIEDEIGPLQPADGATESDDIEAMEVILGEKVAELNGCFKCHSIDGSSGDGPSWLGIYETEESLTDGTTAVVNADYIRESILDPQAKIVVGFEDGDMPVNFAAVLTDADIDALVDYIESLNP